MLVALIVIAILVVLVAGAYNGLVSSRNKVKDQWSQIDVPLKEENKINEYHKKETEK